MGSKICLLKLILFIRLIVKRIYLDRVETQREANRSQHPHQYGDVIYDYAQAT